MPQDRFKWSWGTWDTLRGLKPLEAILSPLRAWDVSTHYWGPQDRLVLSGGDATQSMELMTQTRGGFGGLALRTYTYSEP